MKDFDDFGKLQKSVFSELLYRKTRESEVLYIWIKDHHVFVTFVIYIFFFA